MVGLLDGEKVSEYIYPFRYTTRT